MKVIKSEIMGFCFGVRRAVELVKNALLENKSKKVYSGRIWIGTYFYDENGNTIMKSNEFIKDYEKLVRWIKKNVPCRSRKIGKYVYKLYISDEILELEASGFSL